MMRVGQVSMSTWHSFTRSISSSLWWTAQRQKRGYCWIRVSDRHRRFPLVVEQMKRDTRLLSLNPPTGLWDRRLGPGGRWAGACVRAGAFWGVQDWGAGLVAGGVGLRCAGR